MGIIIFLTFFLLPPTVRAADAPQNFSGLVGIFNGIIDLLIPLIFTLAFLTFLWGIMKSWILNGGDAESIEKGKKIAVVGISVFVVMVGFWGIISILRVTFFGG